MENINEPIMDEASAVQALAGLAQDMRLRVFRALVGAGPQGMTPGALSVMLDVPASTLSFHLKGLMFAGLVLQERDGRSLIYRPAITRMLSLMDYLSAHCCQGEQACSTQLEGPSCAPATSANCNNC